MNSKGKVWQIVLLVLLVLAIIAILVFNNKLNASKESLSTTQAQLTQEQNNSAALQADLDAAKAQYEDVTAQLTQAKADVEALNAQVESGLATAEQLQTDLTAANARVTELEAEAEIFHCSSSSQIVFIINSHCVFKSSFSAALCHKSPESSCFIV